MQIAHFRLTVAVVLLINMADASGGGTVPAGTVVADARCNLLRSLTVVKNFLEIDGVNLHAHPIC